MLSFRLLLGILFLTSLVTSVVATQQQQQATPAAAVTTASPVGFGNNADQNSAASGVEHSVLVHQLLPSAQSTASDFHSRPLPFNLRYFPLSTLHSSGPVAYFVNRVVSITATSDSTVSLVYELAADFPTAGCTGNNGSHFVHYRFSKRLFILVTSIMYCPTYRLSSLRKKLLSSRLYQKLDLVSCI